MSVADLNARRPCAPLLELAVYRHPVTGKLVVGPTAAFPAWLAETAGMDAPARMEAIAALMPKMAKALRRSAQRMRMRNDSAAG